MKKNICIITTAHSPLDVRIFHREALSLAKRYRVTIIAPFEKDRLIKGIKIKAVRGSSSKIGRLAVGYRAYKLARREKADIYHFHDLDFVFYANLLKLFTKKPVIFDIHEIYTATIENRDWIPAFLKPLIRFMIKVIDWLLVRNRFEEIVAAPYQLVQYKKATLIMNLPPRDYYENEISEKDFKRLVYLGSITKSRVLNTLEKAAKDLNDYKITLIGNVHDGERLGYKNISYTGFVDIRDISKEVGNSGIGLVPFIDNSQFQYSVPSKIFDYMAMGLVIVAPKYIKPGLKGLDIDDCIAFTNGSANGLVKTLDDINKNTDKYEKISKKARKKFIAKYNWDTEEKKLLEFYEEIIK